MTDTERSDPDAIRAIALEVVCKEPWPPGEAGTVAVALAASGWDVRPCSLGDVTDSVATVHDPDTDEHVADIIVTSTGNIVAQLTDGRQSCNGSR